MADKGKNAAGNGEGTLTIVLVLALLALIVSLYLTYLHYRVHTDASFSSSCALSEDVNCETVALSPYSVFLRLPVSLWGTAAFLLEIIAAAIALADSRRGRPARGWGILICSSVAGIVVSAALFTIAHTIIHSLCPFCVSIYILCIAIAATIGVDAVRRRRSIASMFATDLRGLAGPPLALLALPPLLVAAGLAAYPRLYDTGACPGRTDVSLCSEPSTYGNPRARVRITEYSDYECPFCAMTHFALRRAVETYPEDVVLVHVQFPLDRSCNDLLDKPFHSSACSAARAAVCAQRQGRFWEMNDHLFTHQKQIGEVPFDEIAAVIGLDVAKFQACMADPSSAGEVRADIEKARQTSLVKQGQIGTPIIYINESGQMGAVHWEDLDRYLGQRFGLVAKPAP